MSTKENVAIERRVALLEQQIGSFAPTRITTTFEVFERGDEPRCRTVADVKAAARQRPRPRLVESIADLDCLIDTETGTHVLRHEIEESAKFEAAAAGARRIDVPIKCHAAQLPLIRSCLPLTESRGGARAGKTRIGLWWLFRQWLLRGHAVDEANDEHARFWWVREDTEKLYEFAVLPICQLWPDVFVGRPPGPRTRHPKLQLLDGSEISFRHANFSGSKAGTNLRSANVEAVNVDEKSAIHNRENWRELLNRVSQTGGPVATQTTPTAGHWSEDDDDDEGTGGMVFAALLSRWQNPWITHARLFSDMLKERLVTATALEETILAADDQVAAASAAIIDPDAQRAWLGAKVPAGLTLWRGWSDDLIVRDSDRVRASLRVDGYGRDLPCITADVLARFFRREDKPRPGPAALGQDFNVNPCAGVIWQIFGDLHRRDTWHVLVVDEVDAVGPTATYARKLSSRYPGIVGWCDPTGAMPGRHESHGAKSSTDAAELERAGIYVAPANGRHEGKVRHLPQKDSINVLHRLMAERRLLVHARCTGLLRAMRGMRSRADGTIDKVSGTGSISDQISAYGDALRYGLYRPFEHVLVNTKTEFGPK